MALALAMQNFLADIAKEWVGNPFVSEVFCIANAKAIAKSPV